MMEHEGWEKAAGYLDDLPPNLGWFTGGQQLYPFHLITEMAKDHMTMYCGGRLPLPLVYSYHHENWRDHDQNMLCQACCRKIDNWRASRLGMDIAAERTAFVPKEEVANEYDHYQEIVFRSICHTSTDYARSYLKKASLETLQRCLAEIEGRPHYKTLRTMIERRIRVLEKEGEQCQT